MRFLADMGISPHVVAFVRALGHEAVHLHELGLDRLADADILSKARAEDYVVLTHDLDFGALMAASHWDWPSVVIFRLQDMRPIQVNAVLEIILLNHRSVLEQGAILSVTEKRLRVRRLPLMQ